MDLKLAEERTCIQVGSKEESFLLVRRPYFYVWIQFEYAPKMNFRDLSPGKGGCSWQNPISAEPASGKGFPTKDWALKMVWSITQEEIETIHLIFLY